MRARPRTDNFRANAASVVAIMVGATLAAVLFGGDEMATSDIRGATIRLAFLAYLFTRPVLVFVFTWWTYRDHMTFRRPVLTALTRIEMHRRTRWWSKWAGTSGALSWTLVGALVSVTLTITAAVVPSLRADLLVLVLCAVNVVASWLLMVFTFGLEYFRFHLAPPPDHSGAAITLDVPKPYALSDFLTLAVLLSTMAATVSAQIHSRAVWRLVRANVLCAFAFNTVIVAMSVSLLYSGITA